MHHLRVDEWSRGSSYIHARDPRAKIAALLVFLVALATTPPARSVRLFGLQMLTYAAVLWIGSAAARLPAGALEVRAMVVLPFTAIFAAITWLAGDPSRALLMFTKSYLSALAVILVVATTPIPLLLRGLQSLGAPRILVLIVQFLHRYLFVISEQAQHMRLAAACRQAGSKTRPSAKFRAAAGAVSVLFARSYNRAEGIHRAMLSRGFQGQFVDASKLRFTSADALFGTLFLIVICSLRLAFPVR